MKKNIYIYYFQLKFSVMTFVLAHMFIFPSPAWKSMGFLVVCKSRLRRNFHVRNIAWNFRSLH